MAKLSRRIFIAGAAAAPLAGAARVGGASCAKPSTPAPARASVAKSDPIVAKVAEWIAVQDTREAMMLEWQDWENALCAKIKPTRMNLTQAARSGLPEARAMRALDRKIKTAGKKLDRAAGRIVLMQPISQQGALAKIELGLRIQGPYDWEDYAYALLQDGFEQLRRRL